MSVERFFQTLTKQAVLLVNITVTTLL